MDFTAIDFETANRHRESACQLGAVRVRNSTIVEKWVWLIRPQPMFFAPGNIRVHGITPDQVASEKTFGDLWPEIFATLDGECLVAHNASFDIGVLRACLMKHRCEVPEMLYTCTRAIARRTWVHRRRFGLKPLSEWLGIQFQHHDALEDSIACAKILMAAGTDQQATSLEDLEAKLQLSRGRAGQWGQSGPSLPRTSRRRTAASRSDSGFSGDHVRQSRAGYAISPAQPTSNQPPPMDLQRLLIRAEFIRPLAGKRIYVASDLRTLTQTQARELAGRLGGEAEADLSATTDVLVIEPGGAEQDRLKTKAEADGITVVGEEGFLSLLIADPIDIQ